MELEVATLAHILKLPVPKNISTKEIPANTFGVFATIRRSLKLNEWPEDIHGCIGYWSNDYSTITPKEIISHLMDVSNSAMYTNDRRNKFPPFETDPNTSLEIDLMLQPLIPINPTNGLLSNGTVFDNDKYGLIFENKATGKRATYLPNVFINQKWEKIRDDLIAKSRTNTPSKINNTTHKFYAYEIKKLLNEKTGKYETIHIKFFDIVSNVQYIKYLETTFSKNLLKIITKSKRIPYEITGTGIVYKENELIRNFSVLETLIRCSTNNNKQLPITITKLLIPIITNFQKLLPNNDYQAQANYITLAIMWNKSVHKTYQVPIIAKTIAKLITRIPNAEPAFERGQIVLAILEYYNYTNMNSSGRYKFIESIIKLYENENYPPLGNNKNNNNIDNVFKMNWDSQALCSMLNNYNVSGNANNTKAKIIKQIKKIMISYIKSFPEIFNNISAYETNYRAVIFEGANTIYKTIMKYNEVENNVLPITENEIFGLKEVIFTSYLKTMFMMEDGFLNFKDATARLDITCHLLNGL